MVVQILFWCGAALVLYTYLGYPALLWIRARARQCPIIRDDSVRTVSVVIVAHNEEKLIRRRLRNLLCCDFPHESLEIIVACDGATDTTASLARTYRAQRVRVLEFVRRRGKSAVLNDTIRHVQGEIVVLTDVRQRFAKDAIRRLVADFAHSDVGAVSGRLILKRAGDRGQTAGGMDFYWRYETFIRLNEARVDSTVGVSGAIYAIRRSCFRRIPDVTILDDVLIPMSIVRAGYRVVYEPAAIAYDRIPVRARSESVRKIRTIGGNFQLLMIAPWLLVPFLNRLWVQTLSHKFLRLVSPLFLITMFALNAMLLSIPLYHAAFVLQGGFYLAGIAGWMQRNRPRKWLVFNVPYTFCLLNFVTVLAFLQFARGHQSAAWERS